MFYAKSANVSKAGIHIEPRIVCLAALCMLPVRAAFPYIETFLESVTRQTKASCTSKTLCLQLPNLINLPRQLDHDLPQVWTILAFCSKQGKRLWKMCVAPAQPRRSNAGSLLLSMTAMMGAVSSLAFAFDMLETPMLVRKLRPPSIYESKGNASVWKRSTWGMQVRELEIVRQGAVTVEPERRNIELLLEDGMAEYELTHTFRPEVGKGMKDYSVVPSSSNTDVLTAEDASPSIVDTGDGSYNITTLLEFARSPGLTYFTLNFVDTQTFGTVATAPMEFVVAGIAFYHKGSSGKRLQVGQNFGNLTLSAAELATNNRVWVEAIVQYMDGTSSYNELRLGMGGILISITGLQNGQILYDAATCAPDSGYFDGATVTTLAGCGVAFSTNSIGSYYLGPQLGLTFVPNRVGSFVINFEWAELVVGSDAEIGSAYSTYLNVDVVGKKAPEIQSLEPTGPLPMEGGTTMTVKGDFQAFDINDNSSYISIGATALNKSSITSANKKTIVFVMPPMSVLTGGVNGIFAVKIHAGGLASP
jgi:IPT/TIG domain